MKTLAIALLAMLLLAIGVRPSHASTPTPTPTATPTPVAEMHNFYGTETMLENDKGNAGDVRHSSGSSVLPDYWGPAVPTPAPTATPVIGGGGALATGSGNFGRITGLAATSNVLTLPSAACPNDLTCIFQDNTTAGGCIVTAQSATSVTFSATASDAADYSCGCR